MVFSIVQLYKGEQCLLKKRPVLDVVLRAFECIAFIIGALASLWAGLNHRLDPITFPAIVASGSVLALFALGTLIACVRKEKLPPLPLTTIQDLEAALNPMPKPFHPSDTPDSDVVQERMSRAFLTPQHRWLKRLTSATT